MTSSSRRLSFSSMSSTRRQIKYGKGKYANIELVPQPSDDEEDPLNWPMWKKELNLGALLMTVALANVTKTALISVNSQLAMGYSISYTAAAALTGVPLMVSAFTGLISLVAARIWGRRPLYLVSMTLLFIGMVWNTFVQESFAQCMAARVFQGLGWGAFDTLVLGSIHDTYFEHERGLRIAIYNIAAVVTTWGPPLIGGVASSSSKGFTLQFEILSCFQAVAIPLVVFAAPETVFNRASYFINTPASAWSNKMLPLKPKGQPLVEKAKDYLRGMKPLSYNASYKDSTIILQAPRALIAPTTMLLVLVSVLPICALWGMAGSLSLLFSPMPFMLNSAKIGTLMTGPWLAATAVVAGFAFFPRWHKTFLPNYNIAAIASGSSLAFAGLLSFGLYVETCMNPSSMNGDAKSSSSVFAIGGDPKLSFSVVSFTLALIAAGVYTLDATTQPLVRRSTQFTSSNLAIALRNSADMDAGVGIWRSLVAGAFVIAIPNLVWSWDGLKSTSVGIAVAQAFAAALVGTVWWQYDEHIRRLDGRVMRCVDMEMVKRQGSFFDMD